MPLDYRKQYPAEQLEAFWPNGAIRGIAVSLCTLAVLTVLAVLPVILEHWELTHWMEESNPANARVTPIHIRPEWYFLASFQWLKLFPQEFLGVSGKTLGVVTQGVIVFALVFLPYLVSRWSRSRPGAVHTVLVTLSVVVFVALTVWGTWPPTPLFVILVGAVVLVFYLMVAAERLRYRRMMGKRRELGE